MIVSVAGFSYVPSHGDSRSGFKNRIIRRHSDIDRGGGCRGRFEIEIVINKLPENIKPGRGNGIGCTGVLAIRSCPSGNNIAYQPWIWAAHRRVIRSGGEIMAPG
jgi:hypothetical protein